jgi:hypothetical protein
MSRSARRCVNRGHRALDVSHAFNLGNHQVAQDLAGTAHDGVDIGIKSLVTHRMHTHRYPWQHGRGLLARIRMRLKSQRNHHLGMVAFGTHGGPVFAIQRSIKNAGPEFGRQFGLQLQAFAHAHLNATVMVANRQKPGRSLGAQKDISRV